MTGPYGLTVNGHRHEIADGWVGESLLFVLRERLGLPGSKNACEEGECGSCTVRLDDQLVCSCLVLAAAAADRSVTTVEGLSASHEADGSLSDVQQAFVDAGAVQCGFCTPGLLMAVDDLLNHYPDRVAQVRHNPSRASTPPMDSIGAWAPTQGCPHCNLVCCEQ